MSRIVLTTMGSLGDLHPLISIGSSLRDRGHQVVFATFEIYRSAIEPLGFEFHPLRPTALEDEDSMAMMMDLKTGTEKILRDYVFANIRDTYTDILNIAQGADFIVAGELVYAARIAAEKLGIGWCVCILAPASLFSAYDPPVLPPYPFLAKLRPLGFRVNRLVIDLAAAVTRKWSQPLHDLRQELGLLPVGNPVIESKYSPYLVLVLFSPVMGTLQPDRPASAVQTGFTFYDGHPETKLAPELEHFLDRGEPPIVFTLGSAAVLAPGQFFQESMAAAKQLHRRAVLLIGKNPPPAGLTDEIFAWDYAPYSQLFPRASAIVHQGGIGTTAQALRSSRPTLVTPYSHDQPDNAARLVRLGTSRTIKRDRYRVDRVARELKILLEHPSYADRAAAVGRVLESENGTEVACNAIERSLKQV
jgi:rhamnosyltransferase subunit B